MSGWPIVRLGDFIEVKGGKRLPKGHVLQTNDNGAPYIRIVDIEAGNVVEANLVFVPEETQHHIDRYRVFTDDIFISIVGTVGVTALIPKSLDRAFLTENAARLVVSNRNLSSKYLRYVLASDTGQHSIREQTVGSTQPKLALGRIKDIAIPLPPTDVQEAITEVLGALDDKIAANARVVATARAMQAAEFARLMSGVTNPSIIGDVLTLEYGKPLLAQARIVGDVDVFGSGGVVGAHSEALMSGPGVVVGRKGTAGAVHWAPKDYYPIDTTFFVASSDIEIYSMIFCYHLLRSIRLSEQNSDSAVPGLNRNDAHAIKIRLPDKDSIRQFTLTAMPHANLAAQFDRESLALAAIRDALLPQLMSGKLRVKDAEKSLVGVL